MHEAMVAESLLRSILAEAKQQNGRPIAAKISCGTLDPVNDEVLCFAFEAIAKGTACEGMKLEVEHKPMQARCKQCGHSFSFEFFSATCSKCGSEEFELLPDAALMLETIEFDTEQ